MSKQSAEKQVAGVIDALAAKRMKLEKSVAAKPQWRTSCRLELPGWPPLNIPVERRIDLIAYAIEQLTRLKAGMGRLKVKPVWDGYSIGDWVADLKARVQSLRDATALEQVRAMERKANPLLTEGQMRERKLAEILAGMESMND